MSTQHLQWTGTDATLQRHTTSAILLSLPSYLSFTTEVRGYRYLNIHILSVSVKNYPYPYPYPYPIHSDVVNCYPYPIHIHGSITVQLHRELKKFLRTFLTVASTLDVICHSFFVYPI